MVVVENRGKDFVFVRTESETVRQFQQAAVLPAAVERTVNSMIYGAKGEQISTRKPLMSRT